ncbi:type II toxin-antitoxin system VapC family toxin [Tunturiibacter gelidoferens]|uniref:PIN domain-containing protein n=1 Tax=Tunturiibacter gelidiferens TaxID=3069689 RepID=A0AAU7Z2A4_9BACT
MNFVDTSVIVAASQPYDPRQPACLDRLAVADARGGACAIHTLSEIFAVLTRLPLPYRLPADAALQIVKHTSKRFNVIALTPAEQMATIERFVAEGLTGAMIYDALILSCARKANATRIYTLNPRHFKQVAPDLAARIHEP